MESKTILNTPYTFDDRVILLANFLSDYITEPGVEIEAKIGHFRFTKAAPQISHITLLDYQTTPFNFESSMNPQYFQSLLGFMISAGHQPVVSDTADHLYNCNERFAKVRKTCNPVTQDVIEVTKKTKLFDLNFLVNASTGMGFRISANREEILDAVNPAHRFSGTRLKNRHSFALKYLELDMTKAKMEGHEQQSYEVELEIKDVEFVKQHAEVFQTGADLGPLLGIANKVWNNILALVQFNAPAPRPVWKKDHEFQQFDQRRTVAYEGAVGCVKPVIGDYLFHVAAELQAAME
mmetsp:Transcript_949/g.2278  ORF Transcript_949/g.2278 Transcript_949/m.2278 type:complete len:294 (-) Transcript_949:4663-5544(-)|eukprot:CAMPEP_0204899338 /NCGR_PEP_ID=MMETSP1397-20131031/1796_1 /ASSEMBLY_ACC=CAM_ASM_000891 /TAXON_ID=49980 /ORGANISM="Climacostomum Climacostomum virens, Strain Stock W-24" /LENGTH=293 /DNA_ID=CAMNT_0052067289 /DNA_START=196 /DNA_END=1077 /DNA_ORIENTATION=-